MAVRGGSIERADKTLVLAVRAQWECARTMRAVDLHRNGRCSMHHTQPKGCWFGEGVQWNAHPTGLEEKRK